MGRRPDILDRLGSSGPLPTRDAVDCEIKDLAHWLELDLTLPG
jgi:hypothetical protein